MKWKSKYKSLQNEDFNNIDLKNEIEKVCEETIDDILSREINQHKNDISILVDLLSNPEKFTESEIRCFIKDLVTD